MRHYDYIIAGSGLAGLYTAYHAAAYGKVALLTKSGITESNSYFAQGGIAAVTDEDDAPALRGHDYCRTRALRLPSCRYFSERRSATDT